MGTCTCQPGTNVFLKHVPPALSPSLSTGALQGFEGAIIAITHNQAFANSLNATHVLRVADGRAALSTNMGLSAKDFQHTPPKPAPTAAAKAAPAAAAKGPAKGATATSSSNGKGSGDSKVSTSPVSASQAPASAAAAAQVTDSKPTTPAAPAKKRTTLSWAEQQEYQRLQKEVAALEKQRDELQGKLAKVGAAVYVLIH